MTLNVPAIWTNDCQGKKDFDGILVTLSTRYWPNRLGIKPSAKAEVYIGSTNDEFLDGVILLTEVKIEADSENEVKNQIENWASIQYNRIASILLKEFGK